MSNETQNFYPSLANETEQPIISAPAYEQQQFQQNQQPTPVAAPPIVNMPPIVLPVLQQNFPVGPTSIETQCPQCRCHIRTEVRHRSTAKTHIACLLLSWTCCCCCLPYCMDSCCNANHFCPMCGHYIGTYQS